MRDGGHVRPKALSSGIGGQWPKIRGRQKWEPTYCIKTLLALLLFLDFSREISKIWFRGGENMPLNPPRTAYTRKWGALRLAGNCHRYYAMVWQLIRVYISIADWKQVVFTMAKTIKNHGIFYHFLNIFQWFLKNYQLFQNSSKFSPEIL